MHTLKSKNKENIYGVVAMKPNTKRKLAEWTMALVGVPILLTLIGQIIVWLVLIIENIRAVIRPPV